MKLIIEDEQIARCAGLRVRQRFEHFDWVYVEESSEHFIHREKRCGHPAGGCEETSTVHAEFPAGRFCKFMKARLNPFLLFGLRRRHVFAIGDHPGGDRRLRCAVGVGT